MLLVIPARSKSMLQGIMVKYSLIYGRSFHLKALQADASFPDDRLTPVGEPNAVLLFEFPLSVIPGDRLNAPTFILTVRCVRILSEINE